MFTIRRQFPIRRERIFGFGPVGFWHQWSPARVLAFAESYNAQHRTPRQHIGPITRTYTRVLKALLGFTSRGGLCFPSHAAIAERAHCCRDTDIEAMKLFEQIGLVTWRYRVIRTKLRDAAGVLINRTLRTSNQYLFRAIGAAVNTSAAVLNNPTGTDLFKKTDLDLEPVPDPRSPLERALRSLGAAIEARNRIEKGGGTFTVKAA